MEEMLEEIGRIVENCTICGRNGHTSTYCWYQSAIDAAKTQKNSVEHATSERRCWFGEAKLKKEKVDRLRSDF